jgi:putative component of membrane protein insertase Oxa1/YidC/SpoIIIJ protein YidD
MAKLTFITLIINIFLSPAYAECLNSKNLSIPTCEVSKNTKEQMDFNSYFVLYRGFFSFHEYRKCRLQPTCSLFLVMAIKKYGLFNGLLKALARAQMEHSDQGGFLKNEIASDGQRIYLDPVELWP